MGDGSACCYACLFLLDLLFPGKVDSDLPLLMVERGGLRYVEQERGRSV